ncbi:DUF4935 domain-containing protein [Stenotrophomonas maltophilia]|uniref:PIN-like domain-containing protein n=1 Tax=Stenotrophomonas maltophilia TaxID=40324 RepID=UPI001AAF6274|nr:PIN-like domain-containing protein [Stenotrophomonas maltophilia]MBO3002907.1 DUF4935 domain-containing protein [Stenotrophomonas maltophilia]MBP1381362.1 DUF4935 domain-containing protein [Stenotrophomonas maltophilia]MBP1385606.1 DUF4935 domain-containing protein [Stenotrophomonas maltophilia]
MGYIGDAKGGQATCTCGGTTVFDGAVIGQVFTGNVNIHCDSATPLQAYEQTAAITAHMNKYQAGGCMRKQFAGYFDPTSAQLEALWGEYDSVIALDTNVLLGLYRMPSETRKEVTELLARLKERIWVPYHVLLEFHRNRIEAMRSEYAASKQLGKDAKNAYDVFRAAISNERARERACWAQVSEKLEEMDKKADELFKVTKTESSHYVSPNEVDPVLTFVEQLVNGRTGARPVDQAAVDRAELAAAERFKLGLGPGHRDQDKAGNFYVFDGLRYDPQYGDYMVWRELLKHSAENNVKRLMLVTSDVKPDWWLESRSISGMRPQPELVMEMVREANVDCFWMYTLSDFIKNAGSFLRATVTQKAITDAKQAESASRRSEAAEFQAMLQAKSVRQLDVEMVVERMCNRVVGAHGGIAYGFKTSIEGRPGALIAVPGIMGIFSPGTLREVLRRAFDDMRRHGAFEVFEIFLMFPQGLAEITIEMALDATKKSLAEVPGEYYRGDIVAAHFTDAQRTEFEITHWRSAALNQGSR